MSDETFESFEAIPPKPKIKIRGMEFSIERDYCLARQGETGGPLHEIVLSYQCPDMGIDVLVYGQSRQDALRQSALELYHLAVNHRTRCNVCREALLDSLIGFDEDDDVKPGDIPEE